MEEQKTPEQQSQERAIELLHSYCTNDLPQDQAQRYETAINEKRFFDPVKIPSEDPKNPDQFFESPYDHISTVSRNVNASLAEGGLTPEEIADHHRWVEETKAMIAYMDEIRQKIEKNPGPVEVVKPVQQNTGTQEHHEIDNATRDQLAAAKQKLEELFGPKNAIQASGHVETPMGQEVVDMTIPVPKSEEIKPVEKLIPEIKGNLAPVEVKIEDGPVPVEIPAAEWAVPLGPDITPEQRRDLAYNDLEHYPEDLQAEKDPIQRESLKKAAEGVFREATGKELKSEVNARVMEDMGKRGYKVWNITEFKKSSEYQNRLKRYEIQVEQGQERNAIEKFWKYLPRAERKPEYVDEKKGPTQQFYDMLNGRIAKSGFSKEVYYDLLNKGYNPDKVKKTSFWGKVFGQPNIKIPALNGSNQYLSINNLGEYVTGVMEDLRESKKRDAERKMQEKIEKGRTLMRQAKDSAMLGVIREALNGYQAEKDQAEKSKKYKEWLAELARNKEEEKVATEKKPTVKKKKTAKKSSAKKN